ncbi:multimerin-2a isoform X2 [Myxocyprinus asiaticus]|uniref:multimerin-2a isoform X2 n=1 Tax=Myxocyprinus asiaticus TaxID=70543 RepID=UPI002223B66D|nr:multimerin-2a isoform X2 [Myxocyprinus asiaticus]
MVMLRLAVLLLALLLAARCEVRARDPEVEDEEELKDISHDGGWGHGVPLVGFGAQQSPEVYGAPHYPIGNGHKDPSHGHPSSDVPEGAGDPSSETGTKGSVLRTGNWCAFVHKRAVSVAVSCGTEKYTIKSQSPCPNGTPDCQLVMYKLSTRPVYREKQKIFTALLWRCCPGHSGKNCEETVPDGHIADSEDSTMAGRPHPGEHEATIRGYNILTGPLENQNREQNDFQMFGSPLYKAQQPDVENQTAMEPSDDYEQHSPHAGHEHRHNQDFDGSDPYAVREGILYPETSYLNHGLLPILKEAVMSQLQPVLDTFNLTLEHLFKEVQDLQRDMAQLQHNQRQGRVSEPLEVGGEEHSHQEAVEEELRESLQKLEEVKSQFHNHRIEIEGRLLAQQRMLLHNLTNFKTDMDLKIKRNQKMVNLNSLNTSMSEVKQEQERMDEELQRIWPEKRTSPTRSQPHESTAVWEAITRLDNKVINNTVRLSTLTEGQEQVTDNIKDLQSRWRGLEEKIVQTGRNSQVQFMETGLEVEAAKVAVLDRINELNSNISDIQENLQDMETDVDYIYTQYYKNISSTGVNCDCVALGTSVAQLEQTVANVIVNENRLVREGEAEEMWDNRDNGAWISSVEDLKQGLINVKTSLTFEQEKRRLLQQNLTQLQASILGSQQDIETLQEQDRAKVEKIQHLASIFNTLLQDVIRHSEVLEILLGEEVLEFMEWSHEDQRLYSLPALRESIRDVQEKMPDSLSLASMLNSATPQVTAADEPSVLADWDSVGIKRRRGDQRFDLSEELPEYSDNDFWTLEKKVEELGTQIRWLEEHRCLSCRNSTKTAAAGGLEVKLETEVANLRKNLEAHLVVFNNIFSNIEGLADTKASVDLDKLSALMKRKEAKQQKKKQKKRPNKRVFQPVEQDHFRRRRDASLESAVLRQLPDSPFMFLASSANGVNVSGAVIFQNVILNHGQTYLPKTGTFRAPTSGVYLFVVTLDFGPGPSLVQLKRGGDVAASLRQTQRKLGAPATRVCILQLDQGEELQLELVQGTLERNPQDNTFAGLLMLQTT